MDVGIVGGSGYGGAELLRLLAGHPVAKVSIVAARRAAGQTVGEVFPNLIGSAVSEKVLAVSDAEELTSCDVVFLATPHGASAELAPPLVEAGVKVVDLSGAFRTDAETFSTWYGDAHPAAHLAPAVYGLPELHADAISQADLVANPGCYPTAALLALGPIAGLIDPKRIVVSGVSGSSGAGKGLRDDLHGSHAHGNLVAYGAPHHRHTPEIEQQLARLADVPAVPISFTPHLAPMARGMVVTAVADLAHGVAAADVDAAFAAAYDHEPFVHVLGGGTWPATTYVLGGNAAHVGVAVDARAARVIVGAAIDNLVKGAAGEAIQNANLMCGLEHHAGLPVEGVYP